MSSKKLTIKDQTLELAIKQGLARIGLPQSETCIRIIQRDDHGMFGSKPAIVSIYFNAEESEKALAEKRAREFESKFSIVYTEGQARIKVAPEYFHAPDLPDTNSRMGWLADFLERHSIKECPEDLLRNIANDPQAANTYLPVKNYENTIQLTEEGVRILFLLSQDKMTLQALLFHKENAKITEEDIFKALKQENYTRGLLRKALQKMIKEPNCSWVEIGKGKPAVDDQLAQLELFFHEDEHKAFSDMLELLTVDTRAVKDINVADKNQLLVKIGELTPGSDGYTVDGEILPKKDLSGEEPIKVGPGVYFSDNKKEIYAGQAGHILWKKEERLIDVEPIYVVEGDVDFSGGNIIGFVGKVIIKGDVKPKFTVTAESDIEVHGSVENAIVESEKGNVTVKGTVIHQQEGHILAKGTVQAGIAANAVIRATSIIIEKEVMNSTLEAEKDIIITGNPGVVVGGTLSAKELIRINTLGSQNWVATKVHVGDITELKRQLRVTHQSVLQNKSKLRESQQIAAILQKKKDAEGLDEGQEKELEQIRTDIPFFEEEIEYLEAEELNYKKEIEERAEARLEIVKTIYPGTDFHVYDGFFMPNEEENAIGYKCRDGLIIKYPV